MSVIDDISSVRNKLLESLGDKDKEYLILMKLWFKMKLTKEEFDEETRKLMTPEQIHLHNQLLLNMLARCVGGPTPEAPVDSEVNSTQKKYHYFYQGNFEPIDPTMIKVTERQDVKAEMPPFLIHERLLPDQSFILARLMYGAWELGLEGTTPKAAELLLAATMQVLKNIISAIICWRKGFTVDHNFVHAVGDPVPNPWLRNVALHQKEPFSCLKIDPLQNEILTPSERPSQEDLEWESAFKLAASDCDDSLVPISLYDLISTLKVYPNLLASNFIHTVNSERIMAKICHPSWDD